MKSNDIKHKQLGTCTYLIDKLALRVGNEKGEDEADTVGNILESAIKYMMSSKNILWKFSNLSQNSNFFFNYSH